MVELGRSGDLPLLPSQAWFMHQMLPHMLNPNNWNLSQVVQLPAAADSDLAQAAVAAVWREQQALRLTFRQDAQGWRQRVGDVETPVPFHVVDFSGLDPGHYQEAGEILFDQAQYSLNIEAGPLVRFVYVRLANGLPPRLLVAVHHLVCDGLSLWILTSEIERAVDRLLASRPLGSGRAAPYVDCVRALEEYVASEALHAEIDHWSTLGQQAVGRPFGEPHPHNGLFKQWATILVRAEHAPARVIARDWPGRSLVPLELVSLALVVDVMTELVDGPIWVEVIGRGRDLTRGRTGELVFPHRVRRTVGWFSTAGLVLLPPRGELDPEAFVRRVGDQLDAAPNKGMGLNLLRWLAPPGGHSTVVDRIGASSAFVFNYLGSVDSSRAETLKKGVSLPLLPKNRDPLLPPAPIHVRVVAADDELLFFIDYDPGRQAPSDIAGVVTLLETACKRYAQI
ncbi:condensation domain-containing protein [Micromonospora lutea]|uniref:Condensation domain-containing protein n=1 Tax=Micromonospora lutea TaxID=419825 RepID=A0ABQ4IT15_9ACTN|nr:condensation domain-containing protein [Micromonospora lutea]GIJ21040.1 hypothetical protein Vlu01_16640 [Micromonospora lutea]